LAYPEGLTAPSSLGRRDVAIDAALGFSGTTKRHPRLFGPRTPVIPGTVRYRAPAMRALGFAHRRHFWRITMA
jgi:hypothetical protein